MLATADIGWRSFYKDQVLQQLIEQSLENNRDLRVAALNVEAARAVPDSARRFAARIRCPRCRLGAAFARRFISNGLIVYLAQLPGTRCDDELGDGLVWPRARRLSDKALETYLA